MVRQRSSLLSKYTYLPTPPPSTTKRYRRTSLNDKYDRTVGRIGGRLNNGLWNRLKEKAELEERENDIVSMGEIYGEEEGGDDEPVWQGAADVREAVPRNRNLSGVVDRGVYKRGGQASVDRLLDDFIFKQSDTTFPNESPIPPHTSAYAHDYETSPQMPNHLGNMDHYYPAITEVSPKQISLGTNGRAFPANRYEAQQYRQQAGVGSNQSIPSQASNTKPFIERMKGYRAVNRATPDRPQMTDNLPVRGTLAKPDQAPLQPTAIIPDEALLPPPPLPYAHYPYPYLQPPLNPFPYPPPAIPLPYHYPPYHFQYPYPDALTLSHWQMQANMPTYNGLQPWQIPQSLDPIVPERPAYSLATRQITNHAHTHGDSSPDIRVPTPLMQAHRGLLKPQAKKLQQRRIPQPVNGKRKGKAFVKALEACVEDEDCESSGDESDELRLKTPKKLADGSYAPAEWDIVPDQAIAAQDLTTDGDTLNAVQETQTFSSGVAARRQLPVPSKRIRDLQAYSSPTTINETFFPSHQSQEHTDVDLKDQEDEYSEQSEADSEYGDEIDYPLNSQGELKDASTQAYDIDVAEDYDVQDEPRSHSPSPAPRVMKVSEAAFNFALPPNISAPITTKTKVKSVKSTKLQHRKSNQISPTQRRTPSGGIVSSLKKPSLKIEGIDGSTHVPAPVRRVSWVATQESIGEFSDEGSVDVDELELFPMDDEAEIGVGGEIGMGGLIVTGEGTGEDEESVDGGFGKFGEGFFSKDAGDVGFAVWRDGY